MFIAISHDPLIEDRKKVMQDFLLRVKLLKDEAQCEEYLIKEHTFGSLASEDERMVDDLTTENKPKDVEDSEDDFDNISEASLELKVFETIKSELQ